MTYFLSDPIAALCDHASAHYSFALQNQGQEGKTSQVGCYRHATGRNGRKRTLPDKFTYDFITILSVPDWVPLFTCVN